MTDIAPDVVLLAIPTANPRLIRDLVKLFEPHKVRIHIVSGVSEISLRGKSSSRGFGIWHLRTSRSEIPLDRMSPRCVSSLRGNR